MFKRKYKMCQKYKDEFLYLDNEGYVDRLDYSLQLLDILILEVKTVKLDNCPRKTTPKTLQLKIGTKYSVKPQYLGAFSRLHLFYSIPASAAGFTLLET